VPDLDQLEAVTTLALRPLTWQNRHMRAGAGNRIRSIPPMQATVLLSGVLLLSSCAAGGNSAASPNAPAGFLRGLWHGFILLVTFVISLFTDSVSIYEVNNTGNWYDFGFVLGAMIALGGAGTRARKRR
jgi:hypothetical protein